MTNPAPSLIALGNETSKLGDGGAAGSTQPVADPTSLTRAPASKSNPHDGQNRAFGGRIVWQLGHWLGRGILSPVGRYERNHAPV